MISFAILNRNYIKKDVAIPYKRLFLMSVSVLQLASCDSRVTMYLDSQIQICARHVSVTQYNDPRWRCARSVTSSLGQKATCSLTDAPALLQTCLKDNYVYNDEITSAVQCLKNAISAGICC